MKRQNLTREAQKAIWTAMAMSVFMATPCFAGSLASNRIVQAQTETAQAVPISESDFIVSGNNSVTANNADNSVISNWARVGYPTYVPMTVHTFINGDSLITARGITFGNTKAEVMEKYGNAESKLYDSASDQWYQLLISNGNGDASTFAASVSAVEYFAKPYGIRFHFDQQDKLIGIMYFRDHTRSDGNTSNVQPNEGYYYYAATDIYDNDSQSMLHKGEVILDQNTEEYAEALERDRYPFGLMADPVTDIKIANAADNAFTVYYEVWPGIEQESYYNEDLVWKESFHRDNDKWVADGSQTVSDVYWVFNDSDTFTIYASYDHVDWETGMVMGHYTEIKTYKRIQ